MVGNTVRLAHGKLPVGDHKVSLDRVPNFVCKRSRSGTTWPSPGYVALGVVPISRRLECSVHRGRRVYKESGDLKAVAAQPPPLFALACRVASLP